MRGPPAPQRSASASGRSSPVLPRPHRRARTTAQAVTSQGGPGAWIEQNLNEGPVVQESFQGGSSWSSAYTYTTASGKRFFVKTSLGRDENMFKGEAMGLQAMHGTQTIRVPEVYHYGLLEPGKGRAGSFIVMECLDIGSGESQAKLGRQLALMHAAKPKEPMAAAGHFGFGVDNTIGGTPQPNPWSEKTGTEGWVEFFREKRLRHMLRLAGDTQLSRLGDQLLPRIGKLFEGVEVTPSILHGDLWSGNIGGVGNEPVIFDPASYYGHHEAEFGMSWCANFGPQFWQAYHEVLPRTPGFEQRVQLYKLYHYLNHLVLFGDGYHRQCESTMSSLARHLKA